MTTRVKWIVAGVVLLLLAAGGYGALEYSRRVAVPPGYAMANGRIEATEIDIATKMAGRIESILVDEGDIVHAQDLVARMDIKSLEAQLREAKAEAARAKDALATAKATVQQRDSECEFARKEYERSRILFAKGHATEERLDQTRTNLNAALAGCDAARSQLREAKSAIEAAAARVDRLDADIGDTYLVTPRGGQVLYRLAEPGEVLPAGGKVLTIVDLDDMYMTVFLPTEQAGRARIGAEARIVVDAWRDHPLPARVTFVAPEAQFTPKQVETREERQKLMFRIKVTLLDKGRQMVKPGMPGIAYIRLDGAGPWPTALK